jgi:hypothetical protein
MAGWRAQPRISDVTCDRLQMISKFRLDKDKDIGFPGLSVGHSEDIASTWGRNIY